MNSIHRLSLAFVVTACSAINSYAQTSPPTTPQEPTTASVPTTFLSDPLAAPLPTGPVTMQLDPHTHFPPGGPPYSLFSPFEVYDRTFAAMMVGSGALAKELHTGVGNDFGIRSFYYNEDHSAAWYGDLGMGYQFNRAKDPTESIIVRRDAVTVLRLGTPIQLAAVTSLGVREMSRTEARIAFGREYYGHSQWFDNMYYSLGTDVGGVWGSASIKTDVNNRTLTGSQAGDVVDYNPKDNHSSEVSTGFFLGSSCNLIFPQRTHDFIIGARFEWQREYFNKLVDNNNGTSQLKLMLELGWRY